MSMAFLTVKNAIVALLKTQGAGLFQVMNSGPRRLDVDQINEAAGRLIVVEYERGEFPDTVNGIDGPHAHDATYRIEMVVSAATPVDIATLDTSSDPLARAAALAGATEPTDHADFLWDDLFSTLWGILMNPTNDDLGLGAGVISNRKVVDVQKGDPINEGDRVTLGGLMHFQVRCSEVPVGETGTPIDNQGMGYAVDTVVQVTPDITGAGMDSALQGVKSGQ